MCALFLLVLRVGWDLIVLVPDHDFRFIFHIVLNKCLFSSH